MRSSVRSCAIPSPSLHFEPQDKFNLASAPGLFPGGVINSKWAHVFSLLLPSQYRFYPSAALRGKELVLCIPAQAQKEAMLFEPPFACFNSSLYFEVQNTTWRRRAVSSRMPCTHSADGVIWGGLFPSSRSSCHQNSPWIPGRVPRAATEKLLPEIHWQIWPNLHPFCFGGAINTAHKKRRKTLHSPQCWQRANPQRNSFYLPSTGSSFLGRSLSNPSALPGRVPLGACESIQQHHPQKGEKLVSLAQLVSLILPTGQQKFVGVVFLFPPVRHMVEDIFWSRSSQPAGLMQSQWATSMASVCAARISELLKRLLPVCEISLIHLFARGCPSPAHLSSNKLGNQ